MPKSRKCWIICTVISALILISACIPFLRENQTYREEVTTDFKQGEVATEAVGQTYALGRGIYQIQVTYSADSTNHYVTAVSDTQPDRVGCDRIMLERGKEQEVFQVWVSGKVEDLQVMVDYEGVSDFSMSEIVIQELTLGKVYYLVCSLILCALLFGLTYGIRVMIKFWKGERERFWTAAVLIIIIFLSSIPLFFKGLYLGHDSGYHFLRLEGIWRALASGQFPVRIQPYWLHDYGYASSVFYGDILLYLPSLLLPLGFSVQFTYEIFEFLVNIAATLVTYYCLKKMFRERWIALAGCFLYTLSVYRFANVYVRDAVGEYCAMIFLPVVVYGFWCILSGEKDTKKNWIPLMIGFSGLIQTHMLSCEMAGMFAVLLCLILIRRVLQKERFTALVKATVGTLLLNAWFLIPFADYMLREHVVLNTSLDTSETIRKGVISLKEIFNIFAHGMGTSPNGVPARIGLGLILAVVLILAVILIYRKEKNMRVVAGISLGFAVIALIMTTNLFPWTKLEGWHLGFLTAVQFPWRYVGIATLLLVIGCCAALKVLKQNAGGKAAVICTLVIVAGMAISTGYTMVTFLQTGVLGTCYEQRDGPYYVSGGEYLPADVELAENAFHPLEPMAENMDITSYEKSSNRVVVTCENQLDTENILQVPLLLYRGYHAYDVDTKEEFMMYRTELGMTGICLPASYAGTVCMEFSEPVYWRMAELLSLISLLALIGWKIRKKRGK